MERTAPSQTHHELNALDRQFVWHPFRQAQTAVPPIPVVGGEGAYLIAADGTRYLDAMSSWWVNLHGHAHPYIAERIAEQAKTLEHVMFADFTHRPACELAKRLVNLLPANLAKVFYSDNGSTAVCSALKIAMQYWHNLDPNRPRTHMVALRHGYHGDTVGAMSISSRGLFTTAFEPLLFHAHFVDAPAHGKEAESLRQMRQILDRHPIACFIYEPHIQGTSGMRVHSKEGLDQLIGLCKERGALTIADEVMTGFGRTGPLFVSNTLHHKPDMICLSKALTGGFMPLGATVCSQQIYDAFLGENLHKALLHGHTYAGNPLGCVAALASLDLLESPSCVAQRKMIEAQHTAFRDRIADHPNLQRCEVVGTIFILEYRNVEGTNSYYHPIRDRLAPFFLEHRVHLRPFGNMLHIMPPYCIEEKDLHLIYHLIERSLEEFEWQ